MGSRRRALGSCSPPVTHDQVPGATGAAAPWQSIGASPLVTPGEFFLEASPTLHLPKAQAFSDGIRFVSPGRFRIMGNRRCPV